MMHAKRFSEILESPGMFVGWPSILNAKAYMDGYVHAKWEDGFKEEGDPYFGFQAWVEKKLELGISKHWASSISFVASSEQTAFEMAKEFWEEYLAQRPDGS